MTTQFVLRLLYGTFETPESRRHTILLAKQMRADRVMLFNARGHNEPAHLDRDEVLRRAAVMREAAVDFRRAGIGVGVNNLATVGMNFSPARKIRLPFQNLVDGDGTMYTETFCPLGPEFQEYLDFVYTAWCSVEPDEVWIDDDYRYKTMAAQCFCPLHLAEFERITGRAWTREEVLAAITSEGLYPNETAQQWAAMQNRGLLSLARVIADAVHRVDPKIRIGFMGIDNSVHFYGSDYLHDIGTILNPTEPPLLRPEYSAYTDENRVGWNAYLPIWCCKRAFGDNFLAWPELESWPYTGFNHGHKVVQMKLAWGAVHGFTSTTVNLGSDSGMAIAVGKAKKQVIEIAGAIDAKKVTPRGISLEFGEDRVGMRPQPGHANFEVLAGRILTRMGLPLWPDGGSGRILVGNAPYVRREDLADFAREGLLLDRPAFDMLASMERDDLLGGARPGPMGGLPVEEHYAEHQMNGIASGMVMSMEMAIVVRPTLPGFTLPDSPEFTPLTTFMDADGLPLSTGVWTREWEGGRLAVLPFSLNEPASEYAVLNNNRKSQIETLLAWLTGAPLLARIEGFPDLSVVYRESKHQKRLVIGIANYGLDDADRFTLIVPTLANAKQVEVRVLDNNAKWHSGDLAVGEGGRLLLKGRFSVPAQEVRVFEIER